MKNHIPINRIEFIVGDTYNSDSAKHRNHFYLAEDKSLMYQSTKAGDYSVLLAGNWRFELVVDSYTGLCIKFQSLLDELKVLHQSLLLPESKAKRVFIKSDEMLYPGGGCHYHPFVNKAYWDSRKNILCIGDPYVIGEAIEFAPYTTMVVKKRQLVCLYLELSHISGIDFL